MGRWGNGPESAEKPFRFRRFLVPQRWEVLPNYVGAKLGTNNARNGKRIRDFPNVPTLMPGSTPLRTDVGRGGGGGRDRRKRAAVSIEAVGFKRLIVIKSYSELRRRR